MKYIDPLACSRLFPSSVSADTLVQTGHLGAVATKPRTCHSWCRFLLVVGAEQEWGQEGRSLGEERGLEEEHFCLVLKHLCPGACGPRGFGQIEGTLCPEPVPWAELSSTDASWGQLLGPGYNWSWGTE